MNQHPALRLTPSNSPFFRNSSPRSSTKASRTEETGLHLSKVIGTTTNSVNGFDYLPSQRKFAYTAGAAAVVATVNEDLTVTQRFFKARPSLSGASRDAFGQWPASPTPMDARGRVLGHVKEHSLGGSPLGASGRDWSDSPSGRSATAKDRVKAATSVALSPNGKWLAVGETGYKPRVLIFSLAEDTSDVPVAAIAEHTFGVHALSFSPDSKYLASLGVVNDGFLYVWTINDRTGSACMYASNKCTILVNDMTWMGRSIITAGLRFVKVWRLDDSALSDTRRIDSALSPPTPRHRADNRSSDFGNSILTPKQRVLAGKNTLLGDLLDVNFVSIILLSETEAVLCAETGEICLLDDTDKAQVLTLMDAIEHQVSAARMDAPETICVAGKDGQMKSFDVDTLRKRNCDNKKQARRQTAFRRRSLPFNTAAVIAMCSLRHTVVELDSKGSIRLTNTTADEGSSYGAIANQLPGHDAPISGVQAFSYDSLPNAAFFTYATNGVIQFWSGSGEAVSRLCAPIETSSTIYDVTNELKTAVSFADGTCVAVGDRNGTLSVLDVKTGDVLAQIRAHSAEIADLCAFQRAGMNLIATASRDRMVQLFAWSGAEVTLLQTMDEHAGAVTGLLATCDGNCLLSCSADRTVVVRDAMLRDDKDPSSVAFVIRRTITLKSAPTCFQFTNEPGGLLVSSTDRSVNQYNIDTGYAGFSFKCGDSEGGEAAILTRFVFVPSLGGQPTIVGVSSTDKSVRLYSEFGTLIARDWGHTEGVTDVALLPSGVDHESANANTTRLVTVAADSTVFLWDTTPLSNGTSAQHLEGKHSSDLAKQPTPLGPPMRKVISYSELSRFRREGSLDEGQPLSPTPSGIASQPSSPQRLRKKPSRLSVAQAPRLEPAFRSSLASPSRRLSLRQRSPSPPSPRNTIKKGHSRRPSLAVPPRSKSTENVHTATADPTTSTAAPIPTGFGSLTSSTESLCRSLRAYRKKLSSTPANENAGVAPETLRELEKELKITSKVLSERSHGRSVDEAMMARLLDQASEKIVGLLDERIKEQVESEVRRSGSGELLPASASIEFQRRSGSVGEGVDGDGDGEKEGADVLAGALEKVALGN